MFLGNLQLRSSFRLMSNTSPAPQLEIFNLLNSSLSKPASCDSYKFRFWSRTIKVFRYSFSVTIPMFFNRLKSDFILV